jgi:hypothetical protein
MEGDETMKRTTTKTPAADAEGKSTARKMKFEDLGLRRMKVPAEGQAVVWARNGFTPTCI